MGKRVQLGASAVLAALCATGCSAGHGPSLLRAGAPALASERNLPDPNAPYMVPAGPPVLRSRQPLLDVNNVAECVAPRLALWESRAQSNGNNHTLEYTIENNGPACRLGGFPALSLLRADGSLAGTVRLERVSGESMAGTLSSGAGAVQEMALDAPSPWVLLPSRGDAVFQLGWTTGPNCEEVSRIAIATPGSTRPVVLPRPLTICENRILITAVAPADSRQP